MVSDEDKSVDLMNRRHRAAKAEPDLGPTLAPLRDNDRCALTSRYRASLCSQSGLIPVFVWESSNNRCQGHKNGSFLTEADPG